MPSTKTIKAQRSYLGVCVECALYEIIERLPDDGLEPIVDVDEGWCSEKDCLLRADHFPCELWRTQ